MNPPVLRWRVALGRLRWSRMDWWDRGVWIVIGVAGAALASALWWPVPPPVYVAVTVTLLGYMLAWDVRLELRIRGIQRRHREELDRLNAPVPAGRVGDGRA